MGLFHKLIVGLKRCFCGNSIGYAGGAKSYGNRAEFVFCDALKEALPNATIKNNVLVETYKGRCEIDTLVRYGNKLFIIEVKHWKGKLIEQDGYFISRKIDRYTGEIHEKVVKSPFGQVKRQAHLLKEMTDTNPWINTVVFFIDADEVDASDENIWFTDFEELKDYIVNYGRESYPSQIDKCMRKCKTADFISSSRGLSKRSLHCMIYPFSLEFECDGRQISKDEIRQIGIEHHFSFDELKIESRKGETITTRIENGGIIALEDGVDHKYSFSRIDYIEVAEYYHLFI